ncbi:hypothetical protein HPP92_003219 [Vanilla planifolia]|uniref:Uncharacterized protein n=1 Tax=Vanilla planifolia TaxID=51239 RepID=A0A835SG21_VANPL|nr:hypothetical protein HPP92_003219 [Vanilla planifolia]
MEEIRRRELGLLQPRSFARLLGGSETLIKHLDLYGKLHGHNGCVNTANFSPSGDVLISGSDDKDIIFWNWVAKTITFSYASGHLDNVFYAQIMPYTDDRIIVTSGADGQVRFGHVTEDGKVNTKQLGRHSGRVHKLAIESGSPHIFYSCGEDGLVQRFDLRSQTNSKLFTCLSFSEDKQPLQLNSIAIDPQNANYFSLGGFDEYVRVYDIRNYQLDASQGEDLPVDIFCPCHLLGSNNVHITGLAYSRMSEVLVSYNDELIYLFHKYMGIGTNPKAFQAESLKNINQPQVYAGHRNWQTVKGVNFFGPSDEYVVSGSDCGHVFIWKKKDGELMRMMVGDKQIVNCVEPHPFFPFLASSGLDENLKVWTPTSRKISPLPKNAKEIMSSNKQGRESRARITLSPDVVMHVLRLQRRQTLVYVEPSAPAADSDSESLEDGSATDPRNCNVS